MNGYRDYVERLNRELDEQLRTGAKSPDAIARVALQEHSVHVDALAARRQERLDNLTPSTGLSPVWDGESGAVNVRLACGLAGVAAACLAVWLAWPYLVGVAVTFAGYRVATRGTRRRRPRSSWSSLGRTAAAMYAAYNSRWLKGPLLRASVPASAGREHEPCGECGSSSSSSFNGPVPF